MSCCKPAYREVVNEKEEEINEKGKESLPFYVKVVAAFITFGGIVGALKMLL